MIETKKLFLDLELRTGGFYELSIQVCPSIDNHPINIYTEYIWALKNVEGPFDISYNKINPNISNISHYGILNLESFAIPFMTYNIKEDEPIETGYNWFDICFYTSAIEKIFGDEYQTWTENPKSPEQIKNFFRETMKQLYKLFPFQLAMVDFEISGQYYMERLKTDLIGEWLPSKFYVGRENYKLVTEMNKKFVTIIEEI